VIVRTFEGLKALTTPPPTWRDAGTGSVSLYDSRQTYFEIFRTQPNVRICVEFFARNIADVPLHGFRRLSDTDRERLVDHALVRWLAHPNPATTGYRLIEDLLMDWGIYQRAFWLKVRYRDAVGRDALGFVRLPPEEMRVEGGLLPTEFVWTSNGREKRFAPSEIVHFAGYRLGISPLETLRRILAEEAAAGEHRESFWRNAARTDGVVTRPATAKRYDKIQAAEWRKGWQDTYAGGAGAGKTVLLQEGETFTPTAFSAKDSEYTVGGKLRREVCAAVYQIPQPFVGILDHATFSNIKEQHKNLYQDCLGPTFRMLIQEFRRQILIECEDQQDVYFEFNIDAKLAGTPEERASSMQLSIGRPWRTVNEGRALDNLPRIDDPDLDTVAPQQGGPSDATAHPTARPTAMMTRPGEGDDDVDARTVPAVLQAHRTRQRARLDKVPADARSSVFFAHADRWMRELTTDLTPICGADEALRFASEANAQLFLALDTEEIAA
jgi:HK97 family phage portal protein